MTSFIEKSIRAVFSLHFQLLTLQKEQQQQIDLEPRENLIKFSLNKTINRTEPTMRERTWTWIVANAFNWTAMLIRGSFVLFAIFYFSLVIIFIEFEHVFTFPVSRLVAHRLKLLHTPHNNSRCEDAFDEKFTSSPHFSFFLLLLFTLYTFFIIRKLNRDVIFHKFPKLLSSYVRSKYKNDLWTLCACSSKSEKENLFFDTCSELGSWDIFCILSCNMNCHPISAFVLLKWGNLINSHHF